MELSEKQIKTIAHQLLDGIHSYYTATENVTAFEKWRVGTEYAELKARGGDEQPHDVTDVMAS